jgi:hypothetical protein
MKTRKSTTRTVDRLFEPQSTAPEPSATNQSCEQIAELAKRLCRLVHDTPNMEGWAGNDALRRGVIAIAREMAPSVVQQEAQVPPEDGL